MAVTFAFNSFGPSSSFPSAPDADAAFLFFIPNGGKRGFSLLRSHIIDFRSLTPI